MSNRPWICLALSLFVLLAACGQSLKPDTERRPNQPMFVDPIDDLKPADGAIADSWFVFSNLRAGDREFGIVIHYLKSPTDGSPTIAITDVGTGRYFLDESGKGKLSATQDGFVVDADNLQWSATESGMRIRGTLKSGEAFDLTTRRVGPVLAYNGTGYFPLVDNDFPTWEYAFPVMETTGTLTIDKTRFQVSGNSWFDRQWLGTMKPNRMAAMASGDVSWTWIATRLPNGEVLAVWDTMGVRERAWACILRQDGTLTIADVKPLSRSMAGIWKSPKSGIRWPSEWNVEIPGTRTKLKVKSTANGQETFKGPARSESVVHISGVHEGQEVSSVGYAEMVNAPKLVR